MSLLQSVLVPYVAVILAFIATNIDDLALLLLLFAAAQPHHRGPIFWGQTLGLFAIGLLSLMAVQGLALFPPEWLRFLGFVPLLLGAKEGLEYWNQRRRSREPAAPALQRHWWQVAAVVLANSGDNLAVYIPLLTPFSIGMRIAAVAIFTALAALWCVLGLFMSKNHLSRRWIGPHSEAVTAGVLMLLGAAVLLDVFSL